MVRYSLVVDLGRHLDVCCGLAAGRWATYVLSVDGVEAEEVVGGDRRNEQQPDGPEPRQDEEENDSVDNADYDIEETAEDGWEQQLLTLVLEDGVDDEAEDDDVGDAPDQSPDHLTDGQEDDRLDHVDDPQYRQRRGRVHNSLLHLEADEELFQHWDIR